MKRLIIILKTLSLCLLFSNCENDSIENEYFKNESKIQAIDKNDEGDPDQVEPV